MPKPSARDARPALVVPPDLRQALAKDPAARATFDALAYTHRKEHIEALADAKKPETRARRLAKCLEMLRSDRPGRSNTVSTKPAVEKMKIAAGSRVLALDADDEAMAIFAALPAGSVVERTPGKGAYDVVVWYPITAAALRKRLPAALKATGPDTTLWIAYPKGSSGRATTLTRDLGWEPLDGAPLERITMIALDDTWAAVKYRRR